MEKLAERIKNLPDWKSTYKAYKSLPNEYEKFLNNESKI